MSTKKIYRWISKAKAKGISQRKNPSKVIIFIIKDKPNGKSINNAAIPHKNKTFNRPISTNRQCPKITAICLNLDLLFIRRKKTKVI